MIKNNSIPYNYGLIKISGTDAENFLQKQLTCDIQRLSSIPTFGAICNVQGRVECIFKIYKLDNDFYLQIIQELLLPTINNLNTYILRAKVNIEPIPTAITTANYNPEWEAQQILQQIPEIYLLTSGKFLPHNINLINLGAVALNKGCYKGQAIVTRMHNLTKIKKKLKVITYDALTSPKLMPGDKLPQAEHANATVVRSTIINNKQLILITA